MFSFLSDFFGSKICFGCRSEGAFLCGTCIQKIQLYDPYCYVCKRNSPNFLVHYECSHNFPLKQVVVLTHYREPAVRKLLKHAKYYYKFKSYNDIIVPYTDFFTKHIFMENSVFIPLPMSFLRRWKRGYNQTEKIGELLVSIIDIPVHNTTLSRSYRKQQSQLSRSERLENVKDIFKLQSTTLSKNTTIYLIDDVISTGATLCEAAKTLQKAGFQDIRAVVLGSG